MSEEKPLILIVDDDSGIRSVLRLLMEREGYRVTEAGTGIEAVAAFEQWRPDIVLMDLLMPVMDGAAACARIQQLPEGPRSPVLMITALDDRESIDRCFEAGATDYITKPVKSAVLRQRMRHLLRTRQAETALRASEARLASIIAISADAIMLVDAGFRIRLFNPGAARIFGYRAEDVLGQSIDRLMPEWLTAIQTDVPHRRLSGEYREGLGRHQDGHEFPIEISVGRIEENSPAAYTVTLRDITRRKQAEAEIERRVQELAALSQIGQVVTTRLDLDGVLQAVIDQVMARLQAEGVSVLLPANDTELMFAAVNGASADKLLGRRMPAAAGLAGHVVQTGQVARLQSAGDQDRVYRDIERISGYHALDIIAVPLKLGADIIGVMEAVHRVPASFSDDDARLLEAAADWAAIAIGNARLFTSEHSQRQLAEALRDTAATLTGTLDLDEVLDRILDNVGRVVPHDSATIVLAEAGVARAARSRGYAEAGLAARVLAQRYSIPDTPHLRQMAEELHPLIIADTQAFAGWADLPQAAEVRSFVGAQIRFKRKLLGFVCLESKVPEFFTPEVADRLQVFANQAAVAIENARLYQLEQEHLQQWQQSQAARTQAEKAGALGRLAAGLAQEIRQPLCVIHQHLDQAIDACAASSGLEAARREVERIEQTTRNVLNFAQPATEPLLAAAIDDVLKRAIELAAQPLKRQHILLTTDQPPTPMLQLAVEQLTQAIFNVLLNAIEAAGERGQIHIVTRAEADHVMVMIVDDGPAIKPEALTHVGEPFFTTKTGRTGLGLAVSHTVVQQHGGTLAVENLTNDRGVVVTIKLPCVKT